MKPLIRWSLAVMVLAALGGLVFWVLERNKAEMAEAAQVTTFEAVPVRVATVAADTVAQQLSLVGTVMAEQDVTILSETSGRVLKVFAEKGDRVQQGQFLAKVDDVIRQAQVDALQAQLENAQKNLARMKQLRSSNAGTEKQLDDAKLQVAALTSQLTIAKRQLQDTWITAPISGTLTARMVERGSNLNPGMPVANIVNTSALKVALQVPEQDVVQLRPGDPVTITTETYPGVQFRGRVSFISVKGDRTHMYPVEVSLQNSQQHPLKAGMFARVQFRQAQRSDVLTIPRGSLVGSLKNPQVYTLKGTTAELRDLTLGQAYNDRLEVLSGLRPGDQVVLDGQNNLNPGQAVLVQQ